jgi:uncharacterized protein (TIGR01732 family)
MYGYNTCGCNSYSGNNGCGGYALILVLFILLAIIGSAWFAAR